LRIQQCATIKERRKGGRMEGRKEGREGRVGDKELLATNAIEKDDRNDE
jgi:hypothetical protein